MKCHRCPHLESVERGEYDSIPWQDTPCAKCKLGEDTFYSVPFDEENPPEDTEGSTPVSSYSSTGGRGPYSISKQSASLQDDVLLPASTFATCLQGLLSLDPELREIVAWRFQGVPYREIARRQGISIQLAEMRHKRAIREWPSLADLFPKKMAKQSRRRKGRA